MPLSKNIMNMKLLAITAVSALLIVGLLLTACAAPPAGAPVNRIQTAPSSSAVTATAAAPLFDETMTTSLYERSIPAVVQIESITEITTRLPFNLKPNQEGLGSGFFIDGEGHILTNNHVVDRASKVKVMLEDGTRLDAKVVGTDKHNDLAVLQIDTSRAGAIKYLTLGDSSTVKPGQMSVALGSPYGLQGSITVGVVSGIGRSIPGSADRTMTNIIQTDAAINPGNSGGPLFDSAGRVIGINEQISTQSGGNEGLGFAVPINTAVQVMEQIRSGGLQQAQGQDAAPSQGADPYGQGGQGYSDPYADPYGQGYSDPYADPYGQGYSDPYGQGLGNGVF